MSDIKLLKSHRQGDGSRVRGIIGIPFCILCAYSDTFCACTHLIWKWLQKLCLNQFEATFFSTSGLSPLVTNSEPLTGLCSSFSSGSFLWPWSSARLYSLSKSVQKLNNDIGFHYFCSSVLSCCVGLEKPTSSIWQPSRRKGCHIFCTFFF